MADESSNAESDVRAASQTAAMIRRDAWTKIVETLDGLADAAELEPVEARGAELFVWELKRICVDIGDHVVTGTLDEAMQKLAAGFGRATGAIPNVRARAFRDRAREEWLSIPTPRGTKTAFAESFTASVAHEYEVSVDTVRDRWLKGLPA